MESGVKPEESVANDQKCFRQKRTLLERYLIAICVILFVVFVSMVIFTFSLKSSYNYSKLECISPACYREAGRMLSYMDTSVDPCENFHNFACGTFLKYERLSPEAMDVILRYSKEVLEEVDVSFEPEFVKKLKIFYKSCLNKPTSASVIIEELLNKTNLNTWPILEEHGELATPSLEELLVITTVFSIDANTPYFRIDFGQGMLGIFPHYNNIKEENLFNATDADSLRKRWKYEHLMAYALIHSNVPLVEKQSLIEEMMEFYEDLVNSALRGQQPHFELGVVTLDELDSTCSEIKWRNYLKLLCDNFGYSHVFSEVFEVEEITLGPSNIALLLCKFIKDKGYRIIHNFTAWMLLLDELVKFDVYFRNLYREVFPENPILKLPQYNEQYTMKWKNCIDIIGNEIFQFGLDYLMIQHMKAEESIKEVETYFENVKKAMERTFNEQDWLDEDSKNALKKRLRKIRYFVGYSKESKDVDLLTKYFKPVKVTDSYVENLLLIEKIYFEKTFFNYSLLNLKRHAISKPMDVNGATSSPDDGIEIPLALFVPPFFSPGVPKYLNYGAIGFVVAHELLHMFDSIDFHIYLSRDDDKWSEAFVQAFQKKKQCFVDQYSQYPLGGNGTMIDGAKTFRENVADCSGLAQIVEAYDDYVKINGEEPYLTGLDYTNSQMLLIRYAQQFCDLVDFYYETYKDALHSPGKYRVIGSLVNFPRFAKEFNCPLGSYMNPRKKCQLWG